MYLELIWSDFRIFERVVECGRTVAGKSREAGASGSRACRRSFEGWIFKARK